MRSPTHAAVYIPPPLQDELQAWPPSARVELLARLGTLADALARFERQAPSDAQGPTRRQLPLYVGRLCARVELHPESGQVEVCSLGEVRLGRA
jgi:hypothetical protein